MTEAISKPEEHKPRVNWIAVATYYVLACAISWPFFWWRDMATENFNAWAVPGILKTASYMWGPGVAALVCFVVFRGRHHRTVTLLGTSARRSLAFYLVPLLALTALGGPSQEGTPGWLIPAFLGCISFFTVFGEELGWRGFLGEALRPLPRLPRYVLIGVMWEFWHFTNRVSDRSATEVLVTLLVSYPAVIALSWLIGEAVERSRSLLVAHALHLWVNLVLESIASERGAWQAVAAFSFSLVVWLVLLRGWPRPASDLAPQLSNA